LLAIILAVQDIADVTEAVLDELRVKGQAIQIADAFDRSFRIPAVNLGGEIEKQVRFGDARVIRKRVHLARLLADE
jgi:hypothetical protein